jgi:hypothetical protein
MPQIFATEQDAKSSEHACVFSKPRDPNCAITAIRQIEIRGGGTEKQ